MNHNEMQWHNRFGTTAPPGEGLANYLKCSLLMNSRRGGSPLSSSLTTSLEHCLRKLAVLLKSICTFPRDHTRTPFLLLCTQH
eukprot:COSAG02_NODE_5136_length_4597_cov_2.811027_3_plen_83_part_00